MNNRIVLIFFVIILLLVGADHYLKQYLSVVKKELKLEPPAAVQPPQDEPEPVDRVEPVDANEPVDVQRPDPAVEHRDLPRTQAEVDVLTRKAFDNGKYFDTPEGQEIIRQKKMNPVQFEAALRKLENDILKIEAECRASPFDENLRAQKVSLYELRSLTLMMKEKGVVDPGAPDLPELQEK